jgi:hypothetical protein
MEKRAEKDKNTKSPSEDAVRLHRWLVSFASGPRWYSVGEFVALDGQAAIDRAIEIFGSASDYRAEEIPWDAAPLVRRRPGEKKT